MDQKELREWEARCTQDEPPACQAGCPLGLDVRGFNKALAKGNLDDARRLLDKSLPLPDIVARLCEGPCQQFCLRSNLGGSIEIPRLERFCIEQTASKLKIMPLPPRPKKAAVIGSGPSSLAVAFELARKGYPVTIFYLEHRFGAWLATLEEDRLPKTVLADQRKLLSSLKVQCITREKLDVDILEQHFDSVFIGCDDEIDSSLLDDMDTLDPVTFALAGEGMFSIKHNSSGNRFIDAVSQGRQAAISMDRHMQGASLTASRVLLRNGKTGLHVNTSEITLQPPALPQKGRYEREEAIKEAGRCIFCECLECVKKCTFLQEFGAYPKVYVRRIYNNSAIVMGNHQANTFINSCSLCGQCEEVCPNDFSMAKVCLQARQLMVEGERMPPSAGAFALAEMEAAKNETFLLIHANGYEQSKALFFPGCQLAGLRPEQTGILYQSLQTITPETGIWLDCCGAPAHWGGQKELFSSFVDVAKSHWQEMGKPQVITACTTCTEMFRKNIPEMEVVPVWNLLQDRSVQFPDSETTFALSDPCTVRYDKATMDSVRQIITVAGRAIEELPASGRLTECCGFGGLMESTNTAVSRKVVDARVAQTEQPIITYCAMCCEQLAKPGRPVYHLLDLLFPVEETPQSTPVTLSKRRENRRELQQQFLSLSGSSEIIERPQWFELQLKIPAEVMQKLDERRILKEDIQQTLFLSLYQNNDGYVEHAASSSRISHQQIGPVTFWVQYTVEDEVFCIESCWAHRMNIREVSHES